MAELRRLFVDHERIKVIRTKDDKILLLKEEYHYLNRVLRLKIGDKLHIVDGLGCLWEGSIFSDELIALSSSFSKPLENVLRSKPLICLSIVLPKKGFEDVLRMCCEIGVDVIQPLLSERSVAKMASQQSYIRWRKIIREAVEQSERLWAPEINKIIPLENWIDDFPSGSLFLFATTRLTDSDDLQYWLNNFKKDVDNIWIGIGPEGGWSQEEVKKAKELGCVQVELGDNILRTSTAAVAAFQLIASWRRRCSL